MRPYAYAICPVVLRNTLTVQSFSFSAELSCKFGRLRKLTKSWYKLVQLCTTLYNFVQICDVTTSVQLWDGCSKKVLLVSQPRKEVCSSCPVSNFQRNRLKTRRERAINAKTFLKWVPFLDIAFRWLQSSTMDSRYAGRPFLWLVFLVRPIDHSYP